MRFDLASALPTPVPERPDRDGQRVRETAAAIAGVPEAVVQQAWAAGQFAGHALRTTDGEAVRIVHPGRLNALAGPDFSDARVEIGGLAWAGDVEIHRTSADWERHGHHLDPAYRRVVLHVVLSPDRLTGTLRRADGSALPELVLLPHLDRALADLVRDADRAGRPDGPPCAGLWGALPPGFARATLHALAPERARARARALGEAYGRRPDLGVLLTARVFRALGYSANADPMETLALCLPLGALRALADPADVLAGVLAAAGWLADPPLDGAPDPLADVRARAARLDLPGLVVMPRGVWRPGGRPANAPRRRLAQAAALVAPGGPLRGDPAARFADALRAGGATALVDALRVPTADGTPRLGAERASVAVANAVLPVLLLDAELRDDADLDRRALDALADLPAPADRVVRAVQAAGVVPTCALGAQGAHRLIRDYCDEGRCARCALGQRLFPGLAGAPGQ